MMYLAAVVLLTALFFADSAKAIDMKVDRVTINTPIAGSNIEWATVTFQQAFGSVPVVFVTPSNSNSQPATVRVRNVTTTGFEVGVVEPQGADGQTAEMTVDYFAAETGVYTFPGSIRMIVGAYSTSTYQGKNVSGASWNDVNYPISLGSAPAVIAQVQTINSQPLLDAGMLANPFLEVAIRNVTNVDMDMALERAETSTGTVVSETIGYLLMESGDEFSLAGSDIKAIRSSDNIRGWDNGCYTTNYSSGFASSPLVIASQNTRDGGDGGWVRRCSISSSNVGLAIDEDQSGDSERSHTTERAGILAISAAFHGQRNGRDIEADTVTIGATTAPTEWTSVNFPNAFENIPHIFALPTDQGSSPAALRLRNISVNGFEIAAFSPTGSTGTHPQMEVDYIAIIPGAHILPNGTIFEVGSISTDRYLAGTGISTGTTALIFGSPHPGGAALLLQVESHNNELTLDPNSVSVPWLTTAVTNITSGQATIALERAEATAGSISQPETIAYFATSDGANDTLTAYDGNSVDYEMFVTPDNILGFTDGCYNNNFTDSYASPYAVATQSSRDGNNGGWVRRCNLESTRIGLSIDEDQANDTERSHTTEEVSVFVFSRAFEAEFNLVDHYAITHSGSGVTCEATNITISAHDISEISADAGGRTITITATSSTPGWSAADSTWTLVTGTGTFSTPSAGVAQYTFGNAEGSVQLSLANTSEADIDIDIVDNDPALTDADGSLEDPILSFSDTALRFYNDADGDGDADGTDPIASPLTAGITSNQLILRGVENNGTGACQARVSGLQSVEFAYECVNPNSCYRSSDARISAAPISENDAGVVSSFTAVNLNFDSDGEAPFTLEYLDAGIIQLHARISLPASGGNPAITLEGSSDQTIVRPDDLLITAIRDSGGTANPATTTSGNGFVASDSIFTVVVTALNADGDTTPNFGGEIASEGITLRPVSLVMPSSGGLPSLLSANTFNPAPTAGSWENTQVRWPEAGTITIQAEIDDSDYLGTGNIIGTESGNIGRFYPDHFRLLTQILNNGCASGFTYMSDQAFTYTPIDLNYSIEAVTAGLTRLANYDTNYPVATFTLDAENNNDGNNLSARLALPSGTWSDGLFTVSGTDNVGFARAMSSGNEAPDGPYSGVQLGLRTSGGDPDSTNFLTSTLNLDADTTGDCSATSSCNAVSLSNSLDIRFGRLLIKNAHGPESAELAVPFEVQSWTANGEFQVNTADNCTQISASDIQFDSNTLSVDSNRIVTVGGSSTTGSFNIFTPGVSVSVNSGDAGLSFSAPGVGNTGEFYIDVDLSNTPWLTSDWDNDGNASDDTSLPSAEINFGRYRGHDKVIYWREIF